MSDEPFRDISHAELARRLCVAEHPFYDQLGGVPCGQHQQQASHLFVLTTEQGEKAWRVLAQARAEAGR